MLHAAAHRVAGEQAAEGGAAFAALPFQMRLDRVPLDEEEQLGRILAAATDADLAHALDRLQQRHALLADHGEEAVLLAFRHLDFGLFEHRHHPLPVWSEMAIDR